MRTAPSALAVLALLTAPTPARAQPSPWVIRGAAGAGAMVTADQRGWLALDSVAFSGAAVVSYAAMEPLFGELRLAGGYFLSGRGDPGALAEIGAGLRLSVPVTPWLHAEAAAHVSAGWTGPLLRPTADVSLGGAFAVSDELAVGPELSYGHVFWTDGPLYSTDAGFVIASFGIAWRPRSTPARERVRTVVRTRVERVVERETFFEPAPEVPPDPVEIDRLLDRALPVTHREEVVLIPPVLFEHDSTRILPGGEVALYTARDLIAEMPDDIAIEGHADGTGTDEYNAELSMARAMWVRDWLVAHGIDGRRLSVEAHGEHRPLAEETDDWTRQLSRRVTFRATRFSVDEP